MIFSLFALLIVSVHSQYIHSLGAAATLYAQFHGEPFGRDGNGEDGVVTFGAPPTHFSSRRRLGSEVASPSGETETARMESLRRLDSDDCWFWGLWCGDEEDEDEDELYDEWDANGRRSGCFNRYVYRIIGCLFPAPATCDAPGIGARARRDLPGARHAIDSKIEPPGGRGRARDVRVDRAAAQVRVISHAARVVMTTIRRIRLIASSVPMVTT